MPSSWLFQYALRKGGSVASCWVTSYCSGLSRCLRSSSLGLTNVFFIASPGWVGAGSAARGGPGNAVTRATPIAEASRSRPRRNRMDRTDLRKVSAHSDSLDVGTVKRIRRPATDASGVAVRERHGTAAGMQSVPSDSYVATISVFSVPVTMLHVQLYLVQSPGPAQPTAPLNPVKWLAQ